MTLFRTFLPTTAELWAIASKYRYHHYETTAGIRELSASPSDEHLLEILEDPFRSIDDTAKRLGQAERYLRSRHDRRSVFLTVYTTMTANVQSGIQSGFFTDPEWVREYVITFAEYYRRAAVAFERRDFESVPRPWQLAFAASITGETLVAQDALLGINAHINYDLTHTLTELSIDPDRDTKRTDHDRINEILGRLVDVVQDTLVAVYSALGVSELDELLGSFDEQLAVFGFRQSRQLAWRNAVLCTDVPSKLVQRYVGWRTQAVANGAAHVLLNSWVNARLLQRLRDEEIHGRPLATFYSEMSQWRPVEEG
jgi:hypothetical protein